MPNKPLTSRGKPGEDPEIPRVTQRGGGEYLGVRLGALLQEFVCELSLAMSNRSSFAIAMFLFR